VEDQQRKIQDKKDRVRLAVEENRLLDTDLKRDALELQVCIYVILAFFQCQQLVCQYLAG